MSEELESNEIEEAIAGVVAPLKELDARLATEEAHLTNELAEIREQRGRLLKMLRQADPTMPAPGRKAAKVEEAKREQSNGSLSISEEAIAEIGAAIAQLDGEWTQGDVLVFFPGMRRDKVRRAVHWMRERGQVRLVRTGARTAGVYVTTAKGLVELARPLVTTGNGASAT